MDMFELLHVSALWVNILQFFSINFYLHVHLMQYITFMAFCRMENSMHKSSNFVTREQLRDLSLVQ